MYEKKRNDVLVYTSIIPFPEGSGTECGIRELHPSGFPVGTR